MTEDKYFNSMNHTEAYQAENFLIPPPVWFMNYGQVSFFYIVLALSVHAPVCLPIWSYISDGIISHVYIKLKGMKHKTIQTIILLFHTPLTHG